MKDFFKGLNKEQIIILKKQIDRFKAFKNMSRKQIIPKKEPIFPEGTLIHGTGFNKKAIESIAKTGIITGQYFGIYEDGETFFCADFHKIDSDIPIKDYNKEYTYNDGRCPFGFRGAKHSIAFIIHPDEELKELIKYDCYKDDTIESEKTKSFVNVENLPLNKNKASSILFGIPSNFISGIVIGDRLINQENINYLRELFPNCYLIRNNGTILYKQNDTEEITQLRIEKVQKEIESEEKQNEIKLLKREINTLNSNIDNLWDAIATIELEQIAKIYEELQYQGDYLEFAKRLKEEKNKKGDKKL